MANILNMTIIIIQDDFRKTTLPPAIEITKQNRPQATLYLGYEREIHYQSLVKDSQLKNTLDIDSQPDHISFGNIQPSVTSNKSGLFLESKKESEKPLEKKNDVQVITSEEIKMNYIESRIQQLTEEIRQSGLNKKREDALQKLLNEMKELKEKNVRVLVTPSFK